MREMPYIPPYHVGNRRGGNQNILDDEDEDDDTIFFICSTTPSRIKTTINPCGYLFIINSIRLNVSYI